jgi:diguanylate cyclase (GGDEF)-like protein
MDALLWPGMSLMRRLRVTSKFAVVLFLLLVPLTMSLLLGALRATEQIADAERERSGLVYVEPLVRLVAELAEVRQEAVAGRVVGTSALPASRDVAAADADLGDAFDVHPQWLRLRERLTELTEGGLDAGRTAAAATDAQAKALELIASVADASDLAVDPQLDSHYVIVGLADRLPRLLLAAATAQERYGSKGVVVREDIRWQLAVDDLRTTLDRLVDDLRTAQTATGWDGFADNVAPQVNALSIAVDQYTAVGTATSGATTGADLQSVTASTTALSSALTGTMDTLLAQRQGRLGVERSQPVLLTLAVLLVAVYLLGSLWRATSQDVRTVLSDISTVTTGTLNQAVPLTGSDEFAQMSNAMVYARDRLTALLGELRYQATHDELTALGNRALFLEKLTDALEVGAPPLAVVLVDLDGFKDVNDSFGHGIGDRLLRTVGARLHRAVGRHDVVCRLGGDEFAVLLTDVATQVEARRRIDAILASLTRTVDVQGRNLHVAASVGFALGHPGGSTVVELMRDVDVALNAAKTGPKGAVTAFEPAMREATQERTELSGALVQAIAEGGQMSLAYQPIVDLDSGRILGVEALVRWNHPTRGAIPPTVFVPLAEATGLIVPLGRWVLGEAVRQLATWRAEFPDGYPLTLDVNLSADQLSDPSLVGEVLSLIDETGIDPGRLVLEITESALVQDLSSAVRRLRQIKAMGVRLALDDFGTGYSSLSYLKDLPVDILKIDRSFVTDLEDGGVGAAMMKGIVELGAGLGIELVCEGIETVEQRRLLSSAGCRMGQGYLWARPQGAPAISEMLRAGVLGPEAAVDRVPLPSPRAERQEGGRRPA